MVRTAPARSVGPPAGPGRTTQALRLASWQSDASGGGLWNRGGNRDRGKPSQHQHGKVVQQLALARVLFDRLERRPAQLLRRSPAAAVDDLLQSCFVERLTVEIFRFGDAIAIH